MATFISIPGINGETEYMKRQPDLDIRVVQGPTAVDWVRDHSEWEEVQAMSTLEFVDKFVRPLLNEKEPRLHTHLDGTVALITKQQKAELRPQKSAGSAKQLLGFNPGFFQKKNGGTYGEYTHDYNFVSHVWSMPVKHLLGYLGSTILANWCDIFSVSQLPGAEQTADLRNITEAVYGAAEMKVLVDRGGVVFTRIWCLFEMVTRVRRSQESQVKFVVPEVYFELGVFKFDDLTYEERKLYWRESAKILETVLKEGIDCRQAKASVEMDRARILNWIENDFGIDKFNETITKLVEEEVMRLRMVAGPMNRIGDTPVSFLEAINDAKRRRREMKEKKAQAK